MMGNEAGPDDLIHAADDSVCGIKRGFLSDGSPWQAPQIRLRLLGGLELCSFQRKALGIDVRLA